MTPDEFATAAPIHPDSLSDYVKWAELLKRWNQRINLVAPAALSDIWSRHMLDSAQLWPHIPKGAETIVDFGSGGGFPGLSLGIEAKHAKQGQRVHLIESVGKKATFLKTVSRETSLPVTVWSDRIEKIDPLSADVITARAFAPLKRLLPLAERHLKDGGYLALLKGRDVEVEIDAVRESWNFELERRQSRTDPDAVILMVSELRRS